MTTTPQPASVSRISPEQSQAIAIETSVDEAAKLYIDLNRKALTTYWNLGGMVAKLDSDYGLSAIKEFGKKLSERVGKDEALSESALYRCRQFNSRHSLEEAVKMSENGISWTQITKSLPAPIEAVNSAINAVISGDVEPHKLSEYVSMATAGDGDPVSAQAAQGDSNDVASDYDNEGEDSTPTVSAAKINKIKLPCMAALDFIAEVWLIADAYEDISEKDQEAVNAELATLARALTELAEASHEAAIRLETLGV